jgi:hypothetical protein
METYDIPTFIDTSIISVVVNEETTEYCINKHTSEIKFQLMPKKEVNYEIFNGLITLGPDEVRKLADITDDLEKYCNSNTSKTPFNGFYSGFSTCSWVYDKLFDNIGEITITLSDVENGELGIYDTDTDSTIKIPGVVLYKHRYYALTSKLMEWLNVPNKPRRIAIINNLFY